MADIMMCWHKDCEFKDGCLRFIAVPNTYSQSYISYPIEDCENKSYELFVDVLGEYKSNSK